MSPPPPSPPAAAAAIDMDPNLIRFVETLASTYGCAKLLQEALDALKHAATNNATPTSRHIYAIHGASVFLYMSEGRETSTVQLARFASTFIKAILDPDIKEVSFHVYHLEDADIHETQSFFRQAMKILENYYDTIRDTGNKRDPQMISKNAMVSWRHCNVCRSLTLGYTGTPQCVEVNLWILRELDAFSLFSEIGFTTNVEAGFPILNGEIVKTICSISQLGHLKECCLENSTISISLHNELMMDPLQRHLWWKLLGDIPRVTCLSIFCRTLTNAIVDELAENLGDWTVTRLSLKSRSVEDVGSDAFSRLFQAIATSRCIRFDLNVSTCSLSMENANQLPQQLLCMAMLPCMKLNTLSATLPSRSLKMLHLDALPDPSGAGDAKLSTLRRCVITEAEFVEDYDMIHPYESLVHLEKLLLMVTDYLPFVHDLGISKLVEFDEDGAEDDEEYEYYVQSPPLKKKIMAQLELNCVGLALCRPAILPTLCRGIWPIVLANAVNKGKGTKKPVPWTGIYEMVRKLAEQDVIA